MVIDSTIYVEGDNLVFDWQIAWKSKKWRWTGKFS